MLKVKELHYFFPVSNVQYDWYYPFLYCKFAIICQNFILANVFTFDPLWILTFSQNFLSTGI